MKNADESWSFARVFLLRSLSLSLLLFSALTVILLLGLAYGRVKGEDQEGGKAEKGEFTGQSKSFARKAKTLANGCFSWAEYLKKGGGGSGGGGRWVAAG